MNKLLDHWNHLPTEEAVQAILPCNGSRAWAQSMVAARPTSVAETLLATSDTIWQSLPKHDWQQAFDSHPRIGEQKAKAATATSLSWSKGEQAAVDHSQELMQANRDYEAKFGSIFLICATGKSAPEILAELHRRMTNDAGTELREAAEQQRQITQLRLRKWLGLTA